MSTATSYSSTTKELVKVRMSMGAAAMGRSVRRAIPQLHAGQDRHHCAYGPATVERDDAHVAPPEAGVVQALVSDEIGTLLTLPDRLPLRSIDDGVTASRELGENQPSEDAASSGGETPS